MTEKRQEFMKLFQHTKQNVALAPHTTIRVGGGADLFLEISSTEELVKAVKAAKRLGLPYFVLGGGSNVIFSDKGFRGLIIKIKNKKLKIKNNKIIAEAGVAMSRLVQVAAENNLSGLEWAAGLPGTLGGAIYGNAGWPPAAMDISKILKSATIITCAGLQKKVSNKWFKFGYRTSKLKEMRRSKPVIINAILGLKKAKNQQIQEQIKKVYRKRADQPKGYSVGSIFKNVPAVSLSAISKRAIGEDLNKFKDVVPAGYLIDQVGLKGKRVDGAVASSAHANFIINEKSAKAADIVKLIKLIKQKVYNKYKIKLSLEAELVGEGNGFLEKG